MKQHAIEIWKAGVESVASGRLVRQHVCITPGELVINGCVRGGSRPIPLTISHQDYRDILVLGAGKASGWMAAALRDLFDCEFLMHKTFRGRINVPDDQVITVPSLEVVGCRPVAVNLPTQRVLDSTSVMIDMARQCHRDDLCFYLISGGGSALLERHLAPVSLSDFQFVTTLLSQRGADIEQINSVRRCLSAVKGGKFARLANCRRLITLVVSDVIGDPLDVIASGPTFSSSNGRDAESAKSHAKAVLNQFIESSQEIPKSIWTVLNDASVSNGGSRDGDVANSQVDHVVLGNNQLSVAAARVKAVELGYEVITETIDREGEVRQSAKRFADRCFELLNRQSSTGRKVCLISGGEPTVVLGPSPGSGGRNQQLVLALMLELLRRNVDTNCEFGFLSGGTDGEDGNVPVAGGVFDDAVLRGLKNDPNDQAWDAMLSEHLAHDNAYPCLGSLGCLLTTAPTHTNVCDLRVLTVG